MLYNNLQVLAIRIKYRYEQACVYRNLCVYITRDFSSSLAIEMYGWPFFSVPSLHRG